MRNILSPDYLYHVSDRVVELYEKLNRFAVSDICRRLVNADWQFTGSIDWQLYKLQQSGMLMDEIVAEVAKVTRKSEKEIAEIFEEATYKSQTYDNKVYAAAGLKPIDIKQSPQMLKILQATYAQTMGELRNFTNTTASVGQSIFVESMDEAYYKVISGQQSYSEAIRQAINNIAGPGIVVRYPSGHKDTMETAIRRCVLTGVGQATARVSLQNAQEMDTDLVLVSAHLGARPEHAEWQGKIYSISGSSTKYRKLSEATGYGTVKGLCGANCRHHFMPYIDGVSTNSYEQFDSEENQERYNNQQEQRRRERAIRQSKRELQALQDSMDATSDEKVKFALQQDYDKKALRLKAQKDSYEEFSENAGLATQHARMQVAGWNQKAAAGAREAARRHENVKSNNIVPQRNVIDSIRYSKKEMNYKETAKIINSELDEICQKKSKWSGKIIVKKIAELGKKEWNCDITLSPNADYATELHELIHARSISYHNEEIYEQFQKIEEGCVELLTEQMCTKKNLDFIPTYKEEVKHLLRINRRGKMFVDDFDFAKELINIDVPKRLEWLISKSYTQYSAGIITKAELDGIYDSISKLLGGY